MPEQETPHELIRRSYAAFNDRDLNAVLCVMHPDVDWPNALEGGRVRGHEEIRSYWMGQFEVIDPRVEPQRISEDEQGRIVVDVHQVVHDRDGALIADEHVQHVYEVRDGLIARMEIRR